MAPRPTLARNCRASAGPSGRNALRIRPDETRSRSRTPAAVSTARRAATRRSSRARDRGSRLAMDGSQSLVMHLALQEPELEERDDTEKHQQHHGQRGGIRRIPEPEADLIDVIEEQLGGVVGA